MKVFEVWHGTVPVRAILFEAHAVERVLDAWRAGASLHRLESGLLLRLPSLRWMRAQEAPGQVFVDVEGILTSARLDAKEVRNWRLTPLVHLRGGQLNASAMPTAAVAANELIDLGDYQLLPVAALTRPIRAKPILEPEVRGTTRDLLNMGAGDDAQQEVERSLATGGLPRDGGSSSGALGGFVRHAWNALFDRGRRASQQSQRPPAEPRPGLRDALRSLFNRALLTTRMANVLGQRQAAYMANLIDMLERRRFDDALRHAIPLSDKIASSLSRVTFGTPAPRSGISLSLFRTEASTSMPGDMNVSLRLRELYRMAAAQLERDGKIEEAAFVYADLLNSSEEAVSLLERHHHLLLAAKLAEARGLAPDLIVRQWFVAGNRRRAIGLARRHEVFDLAVRRLEKTHPNEAIDLRIEWAESLARRGNYAEASDVIWSVETERERARLWIDAAVRRGGVSGARSLARRLVVFPEETQATLGVIAEMLSQDGPDSAPSRLALAAMLLTLPPAPAVASASRLALRSVLADVGRRAITVPRSDLDSLAVRCGDGVLRADLPAIELVVQPAFRTASQSSMAHSVARDDAGISPIKDAALLEEGVVALALGEAGCVLLDRHGRTIARLSEPADRLVLSDRLDRGLGLTWRGPAVRIARFDFAAREARYWLDTPLDRFASSYDGATWFVSIGRELLALDATAETLESIWHNPDAGLLLSPISRSVRSIAFLNEASEVWQYDIPSYVLRSRNEVKAQAGATCVASHTGGILEAVFDEAGSKSVLRSGATVHFGRILGTFDGMATQIAASDEWVVLVLNTGEVLLMEPGTGRIRGRITMSGTVPSVHLQERSLTVFDDAGRLVVVDLARGTVIRDLRV